LAVGTAVLDAFSMALIKKVGDKRQKHA